MTSPCKTLHSNSITVFSASFYYLFFFFFFFLQNSRLPHFTHHHLLFSSNSKSLGGRQRRRARERPPPDGSSFPSPAEVPRVRLSCHLHCNCPLFCHLVYIQQGHANEEGLEIGGRKKSGARQHQSLFKVHNFHDKSHVTRWGSEEQTDSIDESIDEGGV